MGCIPNGIAPCCFETVENLASYTKCPKCGYDFSAAPQFTDALPIGTVLNAKYVLGKVLGKGGFGITYLAYDLSLARKIAIKEYFPSGMVSRDENGFCVLTANESELLAEYQHVREKFVAEGKTLAMLEGCPNVVNIYDNFQANNTAYIVMNYVRGKTLKQILSERPNSKIPFDEVFNMLKPIMLVLNNVHAKGLFHMDISPDNIIITQSGQPVLIDFGAAKLAIRILQQKTRPIGYKAGYSPFETRESKGKIGQWTDIYSMAATIYRAVVGKMPPDAVDRVSADSYVSPKEAGADITDEANAAITQALSMDIKSRPQNMQKFVDLLSVKREQSSKLHGDRVTVNQSPSMNSANLTKPKTTFKIQHYLLAVAILLIGVGIGLCVLGAKEDKQAGMHPKAEVRSSNSQNTGHKQQAVQASPSKNTSESDMSKMLAEAEKYLDYSSSHDWDKILKILSDVQEKKINGTLSSKDTKKLAELQYRISDAIHAKRKSIDSYDDKDIELMQQSQQNGWPLAGFKLYMWYANGDGVQQDTIKAKAFFESCWDGLNSMTSDTSVLTKYRSYAWYGIGIAHYTGVINGVSIDYEQALECCEIAKDMGYNVSKKTIAGIKSHINHSKDKKGQ